MKLLMPQEVQVRYILPALRREFARCLVEDYDYTQKEAAEVLGLTEAAVSQYFSSKRAREVQFEDKVLEEVKNGCERIVNEEATVLEELYRLTRLNEVKKEMCRMHQKHDENVGPDCELCFKQGDKDGK